MIITNVYSRLQTKYISASAIVSISTTSMQWQRKICKQPKNKDKYLSDFDVFSIAMIGLASPSYIVV